MPLGVSNWGYHILSLSSPMYRKINLHFIVLGISFVYLTVSSNLHSPSCPNVVIKKTQQLCCEAQISIKKLKWSNVFLDVMFITLKGYIYLLSACCIPQYKIHTKTWCVLLKSQWYHVVLTSVWQFFSFLDKLISEWVFVRMNTFI